VKVCVCWSPPPEAYHFSAVVRPSSSRVVSIRRPSRSVAEMSRLAAS
jgi:hypothetical protein